MIRISAIAILVIALSQTLAACSICGDGFLNRQTLRQQFADSKVVLSGQLRNAKPNGDGVGGTTEFHITQTIKGDNTATMIVIPRYYPLVGNTPSDFLFFCAITDGRLDPTWGTPATAEAVKYLVEASKQDKDPLAFFFSHLESKDETIAADAFHEFAKCRDEELHAAAKSFDRVKLRAWIADSKVPEARIGVYALMLGLCGTSDDAAWFESQIAKPSPRLAPNTAGLLAGLTTLDAAKGWPLIQRAIAGDSPLSEKLTLIGCLRYFQAVKPKESKAAILECCKLILHQPDLCDMAIDDLRRWQWWDLTAEVLKLFEAKSSTLLKRGIVRYALSCPNAEAKAFVDKVRSEDAKLVAKVEESLNRK